MWPIAARMLDLITLHPLRGAAGVGGLLAGSWERSNTGPDVVRHDVFTPLDPNGSPPREIVHASSPGPLDA